MNKSKSKIKGDIVKNIANAALRDYKTTVCICCVLVKVWGGSSPTLTCSGVRHCWSSAVCLILCKNA